MTLLDLLADDLAAWLGSAADGLPRRVLLWLDPERQFARLVSHLEPALAARGARLLRCAPDEAGSQVALKLALLRLDAAPGARAVAYLAGYDHQALEPRPDGGSPQLWSVYEYRYKGCVWGAGERCQPGVVPSSLTPVSYTHLTLPTICSV